MIGKTNAVSGSMEIENVINFPFDMTEYSPSINSSTNTGWMYTIKNGVDIYLPSELGPYKLKNHSMNLYSNRPIYYCSTGPSLGTAITNALNNTIKNVDIPNGRYLANAIFVENSLISDDTPNVEIPFLRNFQIEKTDSGFTSNFYSTLNCASSTVGPGRIFLLGLFTD